jgi:flagellar biosynthesis/type III secretory pathway protein FliH
MKDKKLTYLEKGSEAYKQSMEKYRQELIHDGWKEGSQEYNSLMALHDHLISTTDQELEKEWAEVEEATKEIEGPTVEEYFESLNPNVMYEKGYREGAKRYKELVEEYLKGWIAQIRERDAERNKEDNARYKRKLAEAKEKNPDQKFVFVSPGVEFRQKDIDVWHTPIEDIIEHQILPQMQEIFDNN